MHVQTYSASVEELEVATVKALSRPAQPDKETMNEAHLRIGATVAASYQQNEIIAHRASVCSDAALASVLQEDVAKNYPKRGRANKGKPRTCRVLGLKAQCKACRERRHSNSCVRRREWLQQQSPALPKRPVVTNDNACPNPNPNPHWCDLTRLV